MKIKKITLVVVFIALLIAVACGPLIVTAVYADDGGQSVAEYIEEESIETEVNGIESIADDFTAYLINRYGADYQFYYDKIIENWGSIEAYLLSFGEKLPEEHRTLWQKFVGWLDEYSSIWAPPFAVALLIISVLIGKKQLERIIKKCVDAKVAPIVSELNKQSKGIAALSTSTKALLPKNDKFTDSAEKLDVAAKELTNG